MTMCSRCMGWPCWDCQQIVAVVLEVLSTLSLSFEMRAINCFGPQVDSGLKVSYSALVASDKFLVATPGKE